MIQTFCGCCDGRGYSCFMPSVNGRMQAVRIECGACNGPAASPWRGGSLGQIHTASTTRPPQQNRTVHHPT